MTDEVIEMPRSSALAVQPEAVTNGPLAMALQAVKAGMSVADMRAMLDLQKDWEANEARKAYNVAFSKFKAEAVRIVKNRRVDAGPLAGKSYAELHSVVDALTPALSMHGLSASWKLTKDERDWMEVTCYLRHVQGHEETVSMGGPPDSGGAKNKIQERASTKSYLERYTLKAICGVAEGGDDNDGGTPKQAEEVTEADAEVIQAGRNAAMEGMKPLTAWWGKLDAKTRGKLSKEFGQMRRAAQEADNAR